ncbi:MAG: phosphoheptose isomerase [Halieaceae bacterium]|jgi:phosphoheptose isomerase|nr:phosphoheptose isomerase [Halieaceae bacterium]
MNTYERIAGAFHRRIDCIAGAVDFLAAGVEQGAALLTQAVLEDHKILVLGTGSDAGLALALAESLRGAEAGAPALPALALTHDDDVGTESALWRDLRVLARDGDVLLCLDTRSGAPLARAASKLAQDRGLRFVSLAEGSQSGAGDVAIELNADDRPLRRELLLMASHCLQTEIRHLLLGE